MVHAFLKILSNIANNSAQNDSHILARRACGEAAREASGRDRLEVGGRRRAWEQSKGKSPQKGFLNFDSIIIFISMTDEF